jgi:electron transport complex protein RnfG
MFYYYRAYDADNNLLGYVFTAAGKGYSSTVRTMCGVIFGADGTLQLGAIKILEQQETPGLGANCTGEKFLSNFNGREIPLSADQLYVDKDGGEVRAMTGATITSRAVTNSIREGMKLLPAPNAQPVEAAPADSTVTMKEAA